MDLKQLKTEQSLAANRNAKRKDNARFIRKINGRQKLPSIKYLQNKLWDLNTRFVIERDKSCVPCLVRFGQVHPGYCQNHVIPQCEAPHMAYDSDNIVWGCKAANTSEKYNRAEWATDIWPTIIGSEKYNELRARRNIVRQLRRPDYELMIQEIEQKIIGISQQKKT